MATVQTTGTTTKPFQIEAAKEAAIKKRGIPTLAAQHLSFVVLAGWNASDVTAVLDKVEGLENGFDDLRTVDRRRSWTKLSSWQWVQAPFDLMAQAARESKVLCVNAQGEFTLRDTDYIAISHASVEGMFEDPSNRGLPRSVITELFEVLTPVQAEWVWIDSLSIPSGRGDLSVAEEKLKNDLINMMGSIYGRAACVVALDAVVMHLKSDKPTDLAIAIMAGRWARRLWCYQEGRFAKQLIFITKTGSIDLLSLISQLEQLPPSPTQQVTGLIDHLRNLGPGAQVRPTLTSTASTFYAREAGLQIDYARSLYPVFGIHWETRVSNRDAAMAHIYRTYRDEAVELICSFGPRRLMQKPGWAPGWITQSMVQPVTGLRWGYAGVTGRWCVYKLRAASRRDGDIEAEIEQQHGKTVVKIVVGIAPREDKVSIDNYLEVAKSGEAYILSPKPLRPLRADLLHNGRIVLLAGRTSELGHDDTFQVHLTAMFVYVDEIEPTESQEILISHASPRWRDDDQDPRFEEALQAMTTDIGTAVIEFQTPLHRAIRENNHARAFHLIREQYVNVKDTIGWTPLHWVIFKRSKKLQKLVVALISAGADLNSDDESIRSPLHLALELSTPEVCHILLNNGADPSRLSQGIDALSLAVIFQYGNESLMLNLLKHGADPNKTSSPHSIPPLAFAFQRKNVPCMRLLLAHNASLHVRLYTQRTLLHEAALSDHVGAVRALIEGGADVDVSSCEEETVIHDERIGTSTGDPSAAATAAAAGEPQVTVVLHHRTPLECAVGRRNVASMNALLQHGADPNVRTEGWPLIVSVANVSPSASALEMTRLLLRRGKADVDACTETEGWTALHVAARNGDFSLVNFLLEEVGWKSGLVSRKDREGLTPRDHARRLGRKGEAVDRVLFRRMQWEERYGRVTTAGVSGLLGLFGVVVAVGLWWWGPLGWNDRGLLVLTCIILLFTLVVTMAMRRLKLKAVGRTRNIERWTNRAPPEKVGWFWTGTVVALSVLYAIATWRWGSVLDRQGGTAGTLAVSLVLALIFFRFDRVQEAELRHAIFALTIWMWLVALMPQIWVHIVRFSKWTGWWLPVVVLVNGVPAHYIMLIITVKASSTKNLSEWLYWLYWKVLGPGVPILVGIWSVLALTVFWLGWMVLVVFLQMLFVLGIPTRWKFARHLDPEVAIAILFATATAMVWLGGSITVTVSCIPLLFGGWHLSVFLGSTLFMCRIPSLGRLVSAEKMNLWALAGKERVLGRDHVSTINTVNHLGLLYFDEGKLDEAEQMFFRALAGYERAPGRDYTPTLRHIIKLGGRYRAQGKLNLAERMYTRALAGFERVLGRDHKSVINLVSNLGEIFYRQSKLDEAEKMYVRAIVGYEKAVGRDHVWTLRTVNKLASLYESHDRLADMIGLVANWGRKSTNLYGPLAGLLLQCGDDANAQIAFGHRYSFRNISKDFTTCDGCDRSIDSATGHNVCRRCIDVNLCQDCFKNHGTGTRAASDCVGHSFLNIVLPVAANEEQDTGTQHAQAASWLQDLALRYPQVDHADSLERVRSIALLH